MILKIELNQNKNKVSIIDKSQYMPEGNDYIVNTNFKLKKSDSASITLLFANNYSDKSQYQTASFDCQIPVNFDSWYTVYYIVLPTKNWVYQNQVIADLFSLVFYIENNKIYRYSKQGVDEELLDYSELIRYADLPDVKHNISITSQDFMSICFLQKCYVNLCQQIFKDKNFVRCSNKVDHSLSYTKDLVWMALNVIKYMVEMNQLFEAQRILEIIYSCNGICKNGNSKFYESNCGCSKK